MVAEGVEEAEGVVGVAEAGKRDTQIARHGRLREWQRCSRMHIGSTTGVWLHLLRVFPLDRARSIVRTGRNGGT